MEVKKINQFFLDRVLCEICIMDVLINLVMTDSLLYCENKSFDNQRITFAP